MTLARDPNIGTDPLRTWKWAGYENMSVANATAAPGPRRRLRAGNDIDCSDSPDEMQCYLAALADVPELRYRAGSLMGIGHGRSPCAQRDGGHVVARVLEV